MRKAWIQSAHLYQQPFDAGPYQVIAKLNIDSLALEMALPGDENLGQVATCVRHVHFFASGAAGLPSNLIVVFDREAVEKMQYPAYLCATEPHVRAMRNDLDPYLAPRAAGLSFGLATQREQNEVLSLLGQGIPTYPPGVSFRPQTITEPAPALLFE